jgi:hypothetical protein
VCVNGVNRTVSIKCFDCVLNWQTRQELFCDSVQTLAAASGCAELSSLPLHEGLSKAWASMGATAVVTAGVEVWEMHINTYDDRRPLILLVSGAEQGLGSRHARLSRTKCGHKVHRGGCGWCYE